MVREWRRRRKGWTAGTAVVWGSAEHSRRMGFQCKSQGSDMVLCIPSQVYLLEVWFFIYLFVLCFVFFVFWIFFSCTWEACIGLSAAIIWLSSPYGDYILFGNRIGGPLNIPDTFKKMISFFFSQEFQYFQSWRDDSEIRNTGWSCREKAQFGSQHHTAAHNHLWLLFVDPSPSVFPHD